MSGQMRKQSIRVDLRRRHLVCFQARACNDRGDPSGESLWHQQKMCYSGYPQDTQDLVQLRKLYQWHGLSIDDYLCQVGQQRRRLEFTLASRLQTLSFSYERRKIWPPLAATTKERLNEQVQEVASNRIPQQYPVPRYIGWPDSNPHLRHISSNKIYDSLPNGDFIRLLEIEAGEGESTVFCRLHITRLSQDCPSYEALSYVWGNQIAHRVELVCNGKVLKVTQNLRDALQRLRLESCSRLVWADAICIDQDNPRERGHQVQMMSSIYKNAKRVIVWLGASIKDTTPKALSAVCSIVNSWHYQIHGTRPAAFVTFEHSASSINEVPSSEDFESWWAVSMLFDRPWFWRLWVIQEVALSPSALVLWGDSEISWKWIGLAAAIIRTNHYQVLQRFKTTGVYNAYFMYRVSTGQDAVAPLLVTFYQLLGLTRQFEVTDPHDRIFALLGLPTSNTDPDGGRLFMQPDYTLPVEDLYKKLAWKILLQSGSLEILSSVQHSATSLFLRSSQLPSWVPNWNKVSVHALSPWAPERHTADGGLPAQRINSNDLNILIVKGIEVDAISEVLPLMHGKNFLPASLRNNGPLRHYLRTKAGIQILSRTMTAGKDWYGTFITNFESHIAGFAAYLLQPMDSRTEFFISPIVDLYRQILWHYKWQPWLYIVPRLLRHLPTITAEWLQSVWPGDPVRKLDLRVLAQQGDDDRFLQAASTACVGRRLFVTAGSFLGLGPEAMIEGDRVCVLFGGSVPFILRHEDDHYKLVGECYVEGLMRGEAVKKLRLRKLEEKHFKLC